jgi:P27 family predicted phage terminase small subunit
MPAGRPPKPTHLHILDGTYREDRHGDAAANAPALEPVTTLPDAPDWLGDDGVVEWKRVGQELLEKNVLTLADLPSFAGYCASLERAIGAERALQHGDYVITTPAGFGQARPEIAIARQAWAEVRKFAQEFGMTPSSRTRVRPVPTKEPAKKDDPWDEVLAQ